MAKTINMECPICKKKVLFVGVHDDEGNYHGLVGCEYENDPWSGLSYALHHEGWGDCPMCTDGAYSTMGGMLFDTAEDAISALSLPNEPLTLEQLRKMDGQPVWVKVIGKTGIRCDGWCEAENREKDPFAYAWWPGSEVEDIAKIEDYGKTWACYAYPPAHIDREAWEPCGAYVPKIVTNADRIRAMSDEELAEWMCSLMTAECCDQRCPARDICNLGDNGLVKWMKQPAEED